MTILQDAYNLRNKKINKLETLKTPLEFYKELEVFCHMPYENIGVKQSQYLLKCFGLYNKGEDNFMLRVHIPTGQLSIKQAIKIGDISKEYGQNYIDITTRQQIELRFLKQKDLLIILERLDEVGLSTFQTGIDNFRNIVTSSFDGLLETSFINCQSIIKELMSIYKNVRKEKESFEDFDTRVLSHISTQNLCQRIGA